MNKLFGIAVAAVAAATAGCFTCGKSCDVANTSGTSFVRDALQKYVDSGEMPGAISILYKDGVQEVACLGYADYDAKRPITLDSTFFVEKVLF